MHFWNVSELSVTMIIVKLDFYFPVKQKSTPAPTAPIAPHKISYNASAQEKCCKRWVGPQRTSAHTYCILNWSVHKAAYIIFVISYKWFSSKKWRWNVMKSLYLMLHSRVSAFQWNKSFAFIMSHSVCKIVNLIQMLNLFTLLGSEWISNNTFNFEILLVFVSWHVALAQWWNC